MGIGKPLLQADRRRLDAPTSGGIYLGEAYQRIGGGAIVESNPDPRPA